MYASNKQTQIRHTPLIKDGIGFKGSDLTEDSSIPEEIESWTVEELADVVPSCGQGASEFDMYCDHSASLEQIDMYFE